MTDTIETIATVANKAVTAPDTLSHAEITRLGAWYIDHDEHVAAHMRVLGSRSTAATPAAASPLTKRLEALKPQQPTDPMPLPEHAAQNTGETPATASTTEPST